MSLFELAPGGACPAAGHPAVARGLLPHVFTLTCEGAQRVQGTRRVPPIGGVFSAALSLESPRVAVSDLPVLWSPDFPPVNGVCSPATFQPPPAGERSVSRVGARATGGDRVASVAIEHRCRSIRLAMTLRRGMEAVSQIAVGPGPGPPLNRPKQKTMSSPSTNPSPVLS